MKAIGLIGGMSWESTVTYYKKINERVAKALGGLHSAKIFLYNVDFAEVEEQQAKGDWAGSAELLGRAAKGLVAAGADALLAAGIHRTALLGTKYTMLQDFYKSRLLARGLDVLIPEAEDVEVVNRVIYDELCLGVIRDESRQEFVRIIRDLQGKGAEAVILGCTEIGLLVSQKDSPLPVFDTTILHAAKAAEFAVSD